MDQLDKPNVVLSLAFSYNQRLIAGYDAMVTNGTDQRKVNAMYEVVQNSVTGKSTVYLVKRPGFEDAGVTLSGGAVTKGPFCIVSTGSGAAADQWVFIVDSNGDKVVKTSGASQVIAVAADHTAYLADKTLISGAETVILQMVNTFTAAQQFYYAATSDITTWTQISDSDFTSLIHRGKMEFMDGYAFILSSTNRIYNSDLNSLANWGASSFITKESKQDLPMGLARLNNIILAFGSETVEVFVNAGNPFGSPLRRVPELSQRIGLAPATAFTGMGATGDCLRSYYTVVGRRMYFLGKEVGAGTADGSLSLMAFDGQNFETVSRGVDKLFTGSNVRGIGSIDVNGRTAIAIQLTNASIGATQSWMMYFPDWKEWFEWTSTYVQPVNSGRYFIGINTPSARKLSLIDTDNWADGVAAADTYEFRVQFQLPKNGQHRKFMRWAGVEGDTARSALNLAVEFSDDDYQNFSTARNIDMTSEVKSIKGCGSYRNRAVRLTHTGNLEIRLESFMARVD